MIKIKNNILFKNIIILLISGAIAKIIGMVGKIAYTRCVGINTVALYTLITPTFMLIISVIQFSFPISVSKLTAESKYKDANLIKSVFVLGFLIDVVIIVLLLLLSSKITKLLHNPVLDPAIKSIAIIIPFVTISSILRGFLNGKEDMFASSLTTIIEEIIKILLIVSILPIVVHASSVLSIIALILFNIVTELSSIIIMNKVIKKKYIKEKGNIDIKIIKDVFKISFPTTLVRLISNLGYFLEPIIITNTLLKTGFKIDYITIEYGIITSYIIPILSLPSFFSISLASALLPNITKLYSNKKYDEFNSKINKLMFLSILVGIICLAIILLFPKNILKLIYNINTGVNYIYILGPFFILLYLQPTLSIIYQATGNTNKLFIISTLTMILKYGLMFLLGISGFGIKSLLYSVIFGIVLTTLLLFKIILKKEK